MNGSCLATCRDKRAGHGLCAQFRAPTGSLVFRSFLALSLVVGRGDTPVTRGSWILDGEEDSIDRSFTVLMGVVRRCLPAPSPRARWPVCWPSSAHASPPPPSRPSSDWLLV